MTAATLQSQLSRVTQSNINPQSTKLRKNIDKHEKLLSELQETKILGYSSQQKPVRCLLRVCFHVTGASGSNSRGSLRSRNPQRDLNVPELHPSESALTCEFHLLLNAHGLSPWTISLTACLHPPFPLQTVSPLSFLQQISS